MREREEEKDKENYKLSKASKDCNIDHDVKVIFNSNKVELYSQKL